MASTKYEGMSLAERYRIATGLEPPTPMTPEQRAEHDAAVEAAWQQAREIYGDDSLGRPEAT